MDVGIGLPATIRGIDRDRHNAWAQRADELGFSTLGVIDRVAYDNLEPLIALSAAAAVTERIRLTTSILIAPLRDTAVLAKQAASLDVLSGGRLTLGLAPGGRADDFEVTDREHGSRGRRFDEQLAELKRIWSGETPIGPAPVQQGGPELLLGGTVTASFRRAAQFGDGWIAGGAPPDQVAQSVEGVRQAWEAAGRPGKPRLAGLGYFALGPDAEQAAQSYLKDYYGFLGDIADAIVGAAAKDADTVRQYVAAFADVGLDEYIFFPCSPEPEQVDRLAEVVL
jgi:alkanesulfonate monooxygenase SsuD/methylene tetrahydromethanopterin reductase-like flavin-dependent oxidoreductase (luciferase family)